MPLLRVNRHPSRIQLMLFALLWMAVAILLRGRALAHGHGLLARACGVAALCSPGAFVFGWEGLRRFYVGACYAAYPLGWIVSHVLLAGIYYLLFTPVGGLLRLFNHDPLQRRFDRGAATYWQPRPPAPPAETYFRPY